MPERQIEQEFTRQLQALNYVYRKDICDRASLEENFRHYFNEQNKVKLTDNEFQRLLKEIVSVDVFQNAHRLRETNTFQRDDDTHLHYTLVNTEDWCKNTFEFTRQIRINTDNSYHRYDVILLINGLPLVQIELKSYAVSPRKAMQQIIDYTQEPGNGYTRTIMCFMQLFIVSNGNETYYFANNNAKHLQFNAKEQYLPIYQFADRDNRKITALYKFTETFLEKCTLSKLLSRYMVLVETEQKILIMRPYQIYAVLAITEYIDKNCGNGYIWHTTGSGKTLTAFKAATLLKQNPKIAKCLFVVDRKDLDRQTRDEFNRFQEGCVEENTNTKSLVERLTATDYRNKVIVTTIQKLALALSTQKWQQQLIPLADQRMVFIFDECHRSQFGKNHQAITEFFTNAQLFGFTGTPIFNKNATYQQITGETKQYKTTRNLFGKALHKYTITHAIEDKTVLKFHIDQPSSVSTAVEPKELARKQAVVKAILDKHDRATAKCKFNALFATSSINDAIAYYQLFKQLQQADTATKLNIACIFSPPANGDPDIQQIQQDLPQEQYDNQQEPDKKRAALGKIINDYNESYGTNYNLYEFDSYYQDVQQRIKDQQIQDLKDKKKIAITIVVDMLLTGFDAKYLNTLYLDKPLKYHNLIQAFSRTNRILNDTKPYGTIIDFRAQKNAVNEAILLFSGIENADEAAQIWLVADPETIIEEYQQQVTKLKDFMAAEGLEFKPSAVRNLHGNLARMGFIEHFKSIQKQKLQLDRYTDLTDEQHKKINVIMQEDDQAGFKVAYLETAKRLQQESFQTSDERIAQAPEIAEENEQLDQVDFDLGLFTSYEIDYDYIMQLVADASSAPAKKQELTRSRLITLIKGDAKFIDESEELTAFIESLEIGNLLTKDQLLEDYKAYKQKNYNNRITNIANSHQLSAIKLHEFIDGTIRCGFFNDDRLDECIIDLDLNWQQRLHIKEVLMRDLKPIIHRRANGKTITGLDSYDG